ncbi:MAG: phosphate/phosphite/phosphonate ABC transporter substrate-binding protein [Nitrospiraceae bacterium]|nr:MAG: phosphate/phosphite/phosphonate ABC transporter substrate-binding protein [Nitrospiraceae bacterium]
MKPITGLILVIVLVVISPFSALAESQQDKILIGLIPEMNVFKQMERFRPLAQFLSKETGVTVKLTILSRYGNIIERFTNEKMDGAFFGSFTGAMAIQKLGLVPIARPVNLDGASTYHAHIYTRKESGIKSVKDMKGKKMAFVEKATTAGYIFPLAYLKENGVDNIGTFFSEYFFAGSHDASLVAVLDGKADIGASKNTVFEWVKEQDPRVDQEIVILAESAKVPSNGLLVRKGLDRGIIDKLKQSLLNLDSSSEGKEVLKKFRAQKFIETTVDDYKPVFVSAEKAGIDLKTYNYRNE